MSAPRVPVTRPPALADLESEHANDHVDHTFDKEASASEPLERAEAIHQLMVGRICHEVPFVSVCSSQFSEPGSGHGPTAKFMAEGNDLAELSLPRAAFECHRNVVGRVHANAINVASLDPAVP